MPAIATWIRGRDVVSLMFPFVLDQKKRTGLRHEKIHPTDSHLRMGESITELVSGDLREPFGVLGHRSTEGSSEECPDLMTAFVNRGHENVRRRLFRKLHDPLAEVRLHRNDAGVHQRIVESDLLGDHRLALDREFDSISSRDLQNDPSRFSRIRRPMDDRATGGGLVFEPDQVFIEMVESPVLGGFRFGPERLQVDALQCDAATISNGVRRSSEGSAELHIGESAGYEIFELVGVKMVDGSRLLHSARRSPADAGSVSCAASTSAR